MLRHVIAPARFFAQIPNQIIRHPRLSSHAVHLLAWQLSLPDSADEPLSATAQRARIKKTAFQNAKRELLAEGFLHEWRTRVDGGRFVTVQLISNESLTAEQAASVRDGRRPAPGRARLLTDRPAESAEPPAQQPSPPSGCFPAAGEPTRRSGGRLPKKNTGEETPTNQPPPPAADPESQHAPAAPTDPLVTACPTPADPAPPERPRPAGPEPTVEDAALAEAEGLLLSLGRIETRLALPARTARRWAPLAAAWLAAGLTPHQIRRTLTQGLADTHSPVGALRWRLEHVLPDVPPPPPPVAAPPPEPRLARTRECAGPHTQPCLFTPPPGSDVKLCPACLLDGEEPPQPPPPKAPGSGYEEFRACREAARRGGARAAA
jgi:hypothetical protein